MSSTHTETNTETNDTTGDSYSSSTTTSYGNDGQRTASSHIVCETDGETGTTTTTGTHTEYNADGSTDSKVMISETHDADGNLEESKTTTKDNETGETTTVVIDANGNVTTTVKNKDGEVISEETTKADDAKGDSQGGFWDVDLIYGDHSEPFKGDAPVDLEMMMKMVPMMDDYVDQFEFTM